MEFLSAATDSVLSSAIEVGIGIVGFTGVIATLASRRARKEREARMGFQMLLFTAMATIMFSFLPYLVLQIGLSGSLLWMICSGIYLLYLPIILLIRFKQISKFGTAEQTEYVMAGRVMGGFGMGSLLIGVLQALNLFVFQTYWPYLTMVIYYVFFSLCMFAVFTLIQWDTGTDA